MPLVYKLASVGTNKKQQLLIIVDIDYSQVQDSTGNARSQSVMSTSSVTFEINIVTIGLWKNHYILLRGLIQSLLNGVLRW